MVVMVVVVVLLPDASSCLQLLGVKEARIGQE
jgi:hypothetical protein